MNSIISSVMNSGPPKLSLYTLIRTVSMNSIRGFSPSANTPASWTQTTWVLSVLLSKGFKRFGDRISLRHEERPEPRIDDVVGGEGG